jgi:hypothetical protein
MSETLTTLPTDTAVPGNAFSLVRNLARLTTTTTELHSVLDAALRTCLDSLSLAGAVVWLRSNEQDILTPAISRVPPQCSASAIAEDNPLPQQALARGHRLVSGSEAEALLLLPEHLTLAVAPIRNDDVLLGLLGFLGDAEHLPALGTVLEACADVLSGAVVSAWLRRQQAEADDVATTLFRFAGELRPQPTPTTIARQVTALSLSMLSCDWSAVYQWQQQAFSPLHIATRVGEQAVENEPALSPAHSPVLEVVLADPELLSIRDLRRQTNVLPEYVERYGLRGLVLVPLQKAPHEPLGLLALGYLAPLETLSSRTTAMCNGLARMVTVALEYVSRERQES